MMKLNKLNIFRPEYGDNKGHLTGAIEFIDMSKGKIELPLDEKLSQEIVALCADAMVRVTKAAAEELTADIISAPDLPELIGTE